ncbi:MAG: hypothetical protein WBW14_14305 [Candidatus Acidiferrum sp.]|jgi:hypothetical protein
MNARKNPALCWLVSLLALLVGFCAPAGSSTYPHSQQPSTSSKEGGVPVLPRGTKLVLKDGTFQVVREYQRNGDRVRYFSIERGGWEEIPTSLVDWDATAKAASEAEKSSAAEVEKIHKQEEAKRMDNVADIDASLQVGGGVFLPEGEGMFVLEGKSVRVLDQAGTRTKSSLLRTAGQVMVPVIPGKKTIVLPAAHATVRLRNITPEFFLREPPFDPEVPSQIQRSSRPGEAGPEVELIRVKVGRNSREIESIGTLFGEEMSVNRNAISIQQWEVAKNVYRFTLSEPLTPGEYVLAEMLPDGLNLFVWDFGVDAAVPPAAKK